MTILWRIEYFIDRVELKNFFIFRPNNKSKTSQFNNDFVHFQNNIQFPLSITFHNRTIQIIVNQIKREIKKHWTSQKLCETKVHRH